MSTQHAMRRFETTILALSQESRGLSVPLEWFPRLAAATARQRKQWEPIGGGIGIHWDAIDEDISVVVRSACVARRPPLKRAWSAVGRERAAKAVVAAKHVHDRGDGIRVNIRAHKDMRSV